MRTDGSDSKDAPGNVDACAVFDWLNLPSSAGSISLWGSMHDGQIVSIHSSLLERTMDISCEIEHLREFHKLLENYRIIIHLDGVQSARVLRYAIWPGECPETGGHSYEEQQRIVAEYQAKWREESDSWNVFESRITREDEQVFDISDATLAMTPVGAFALKLCGHLNHTTYHELYLRAEGLRILGSDGKQFELEEFLQLGEEYWDAYKRRAESRK